MSRRNWIERRRAELESWEKDALVTHVINQELNDFVGEYANYKKDDDDPHGHGKRVPYIGWFWRNVDFAAANYTIGFCGEFVGFMENNKWDYPERDLTPDEAARVTQIVCLAYERSREGGVLDEIIKRTTKKLAELWPLLQTFPLQVDGFWIYGPQGNVAFTKTGSDADSLIASLEDAAPGIHYWKQQATA